MRKQVLIGSADIAQAVQVERRKPGPAFKPRPICAYESCTKEAGLYNKYCCKSHAHLGRPRTIKGNQHTQAAANSLVETYTDAPFIETAED